jgi:rRNA small subunit aminocarboxypropyltransferase
MDSTQHHVTYPPTIVIRHRLENLKKCSLRGLEERSDFIFLTYPNYILPPLDNSIILTLDAPPLSPADASHGLLIIDATWRYAAKMFKPFAHQPQYKYRSLPPEYRTAYPRRQEDCPDPDRGLASIEAIYLSYLIFGRETTGLLDHYYWKEPFLLKNQINN